jgi:hypothetical protein
MELILKTSQPDYCITFYNVLYFYLVQFRRDEFNYAFFRVIEHLFCYRADWNMAQRKALSQKPEMKELEFKMNLLHNFHEQFLINS